jgi:hypothetical protein
MRKIAALTLVLACGAAASASAEWNGRAVIRLVDRDPITIRGQRFESRERVRVTLSAPERARKTVRASANGSFRVIVLNDSADRCNQVRAVATGSEGSRAILKILPSPACAPMLTP